MRKLFVLILLISFRSYSQNLVPNPSFEGYDPYGSVTPPWYYSSVTNTPCNTSCCWISLPQLPGQLNAATNNWWTVNRGGTTGWYDNYYFNNCTIELFEMIQQQQGIPISHDWYKPRTGEAFIILYTYGDQYYVTSTSELRSYAQVKLTEPLKAGYKYEVTCYVLLTTNLYYHLYGPFSSESQASDGFGMYLSKDSIYGSAATNVLTNFTPQVSNPSGNLLSDSVTYQKVSGIFTATGGEEWLVIGNFKDNAHTLTANKINVLTDNRQLNSIYSIDDISVTEKNNLIAFTDTSLCLDSSLTIILPEGLKNYKWSTGETTRQITITAGSGRYTVEASNDEDGVIHDTFYVHSIQRFSSPFMLGRDTFFCKIPDSYQLTAPGSFDLYEWSTGSNAANIQLSNAGTYWVHASYACGLLKDTIVITEFVQPDSVLIPTHDTTICSNASIDLQISHASIYSNFIWNNGATQNHLLVHQANKYSVKAYTPEGCEVRDTIQITIIAPPVFSLEGDTLLCEGTELKLEVPVKAAESIVWNDGSINPSYGINNSGVYWAKVSNTCFSTTDSITVTFLDCTVNIPNLITVNGDDMNDYFVVQTEINRMFELSIYTSWGTQIYHNPAYQNNWNAEGLDSGIYFYNVNDPLMNKNYKGWLQVIK